MIRSLASFAKRRGEMHLFHGLPDRTLNEGAMRNFPNEKRLEDEVDFHLEVKTLLDFLTEKDGKAVSSFFFFFFSSFHKLIGQDFVGRGPGHCYD